MLVAVALLLWRNRPVLPDIAARPRTHLLAGFGAALAIALANPADIVLFAALFASLGIAVHTPLELTIFGALIFAGGCVYWIAMACILNRWRSGLTASRMTWLNRACSAFMLSGACASVVSLGNAAAAATR